MNLNESGNIYEPTMAEIYAIDSAKSNKCKLDEADDSLCHECGEPLTRDDMEIGYECQPCRFKWADDAMREYG